MELFLALIGIYVFGMGGVGIICFRRSISNIVTRNDVVSLEPFMGEITSGEWLSWANPHAKLLPTWILYLLFLFLVRLARRLKQIQWHRS